MIVFFSFLVPSFIAPFSQDDYPVMFYIRERMYFEIRVDTEDDRLTILALDCYATPSQNRDSKPRYDIIRDGLVLPLEVYLPGISCRNSSSTKIPRESNCQKFWCAYTLF